MRCIATPARQDVIHTNSTPPPPSFSPGFLKIFWYPLILLGGEGDYTNSCFVQEHKKITCPGLEPKAFNMVFRVHYYLTKIIFTNCRHPQFSHLQFHTLAEISDVLTKNGVVRHILHWQGIRLFVCPLL